MSDAVVTAYQEWKERNAMPYYNLPPTVVKPWRRTQKQRFVPIKGERQSCCKLSYQTEVGCGEHLRTMPHIARKHGVSVVALAKVVRAQKIMAGTHEVKKRKKRKIKRWQDREPEEKLNLAEKNLINWLKKKEKAEREVKKWVRRIKSTEKVMERRSRCSM